MFCSQNTYRLPYRKRKEVSLQINRIDMPAPLTLMANIRNRQTDADYVKLTILSPFRSMDNKLHFSLPMKRPKSICRRAIGIRHTETHA